MTTTPAQAAIAQAHPPAPEALGVGRFRFGLWRTTLALAATGLHCAGHHAGRIFGCLVPMLHMPALDVGFAVMLLGASIYASRRPQRA